MHWIATLRLKGQWVEQKQLGREQENRNCRNVGKR
jgi:hypothetical protein